MDLGSKLQLIMDKLDSIESKLDKDKDKKPTKANKEVEQDGRKDN